MANSPNSNSINYKMFANIQMIAQIEIIKSKLVDI